MQIYIEQRGNGTAYPSTFTLSQAIADAISIGMTGKATVRIYKDGKTEAMTVAKARVAV